MKKIKVKIDTPIYLGLSILDISKTLMYEFWHDYIKPKYDDNTYKDIANDVEKRFYTSINYIFLLQ